MEFYSRAAGNPSKLAILPGAFNPPTRAHLAMAEAALSVAEEVVFVLPRSFPHKDYGVAGFDDRLELLRVAIADNARFSLAASDRGLFIDLAREARQDYGQNTDLFLFCGRDAAERIVSWDYGGGDSIAKQLNLFQLLVAARSGHYLPPQDIAGRVVSLNLSFDEFSSSEVRRRIRVRESWKDLVPEAVVGLMEARLDLWS